MMMNSTDDNGHASPPIDGAYQGGYEGGYSTGYEGGGNTGVYEGHEALICLSTLEYYEQDVNLNIGVGCTFFVHIES